MGKRIQQPSLPGFGPDDDHDEKSPPANHPADASEHAMATSNAPTADDPAVAGSFPTPEDGTSSLEGKTVYVVDAYSLIYQVFHAMPEMTGPAGQPVGATHGFLRDMLELLKNRRPDYLFCAFDHPSGETFRHTLFEDYKAQRESMPDDLQPQIGDIMRLLATMGIPILQIENYEADDILATIARRTEQQGGTCFLVTGDKDCRQLISDQTFMFNIRKGQVLDREGLLADWGVRPEQVVDYQALVGDAVDNVPGVPLIGPKSARELLEKYGTLDQLLEHAEEVSGKKKRQNLVEYREQALRSRELVRLENDVPIDIDWAAGRVGGIDMDAAQELCREFGFRQIADQLAQLTAREAPPQQEGEYRTIATLAELQELVTMLAGQRRIVVDTETTSTNPRWAKIVGYALAWQPGEGCYVPVRAPPGEPQIDPDEALALLKPVLEDPAIEKLGQNLKYDMIVLRNVGVELRGIAFDTMVADYLLVPGERNHGLDDLARRYLNHTMIKISELIGKGRQQKRMDQVPVALVTQYAAEDADIPLQLAAILEPKLAEQQLDGLFTDLEMPLINVLAEMEFNGIRVDVALLNDLSRRYQRRMEQLESEIFALAGLEFNIDSRQQLGKLMFEQLKLPVLRRTKTGPSTDAEVLRELASLHELPAKIIEYRQYGKLKSTYVDALPALVHPGTGRVHTSFKQDVAATGRLSSSDPNLQNIPVRTIEGREIRSAFLPGEPDWRLVTADYSQIELRVLAHFSGDEALQRAFAEDRDIHAQVASEVHGVPLEQVDRDMRRSAKAVNFGVIYGQSPFGLAKGLGIEQDAAESFINTYFQRFSGVETFIRSVLEECRRNGYVTTILGRRRAVQGVRDPDRGIRQRNLPERIAINTVIQGSAADLIKLAMIQILDRMKRAQLQARMLLQIHDELVFEVPPDEQTELIGLVTEEMSRAGSLNVPLRVDVKTGANWADCEPLDV